MSNPPYQKISYSAKFQKNIILLPIVAFLFWAIIALIVFISDPENSSVTVFLLVLGILFGILGIFGILQCKRYAVFVESDHFIVKNTFSTKKYLFSDILGYRENNSQLMFYNKQKKSIFFITNDLENAEEMKEWFTENFPNIETIDLKNEYEKILNDSEYGFTKKERKDTIKQYRKLCKILNIGSLVLVILLLIMVFSDFYNGFFIIILLIFYLLIGIIIYKFSKGIIRIFEKPKSVKPQLYYTFLAPTFTILLLSMSYSNIIDYYPFRSIFLPLLFILFLIIVVGKNTEFSFKKGISYLYVFLTLLFLCIYLFSSIMIINGIKIKNYKSVQTVLDEKEVYNSRGQTSYYFTISGPHFKKMDSFNVSKEIYNQKEVGDTVQVTIYYGCLNIPYANINE